MKSEKNEKGKIPFHPGKPELKGNVSKDERQGERGEKNDTGREEGRKEKRRS